MPILFDRSVCCDLNETVSREWLVTNGKGGYASGTVAGMLTRLQQGLLVASQEQGASPQLLVAKIDEEIVFDQRTYYLGTNEYRDGTLNPAGFVHLETFRLEEGFPVFTYHLGGIDGMMLEKRVWMSPCQNTTCIQYRLLRTTTQPDITPWSNRASRPVYTRIHDAQRALSLTLLPFAGYRASNETQHGKLDWQFRVETQHIESDESIAGCTIHAHDGAHPYSIFAVGHADSDSTFLPTGVWYWHLLHRADQAAGRAATSDLYLPGVFRTKLWPGEDVTFTIIITAEELSRLQFSTKYLKRAYEEAIDYQGRVLETQRYFGEGGATAHVHSVLPFSQANTDLPQDEEFLRLLMQAANRLVEERPATQDEASSGDTPFLPERKNEPFVVSGYYGGQEDTRTTLIALPGLLLATHRYAEARYILERLGRAFRQGLLPDHLPRTGERQDKNGHVEGARHEGGQGESEREVSARHEGGHEGGGRDKSRPYSADTALWYFYALDHYIQSTGDDELLDSLAGVLEECLDWYIRGTLNGIGVDARDGLLQAQSPGKALTWMNAMAPHERHTPVTPRMGKAVEMNALWYHALSLMQEWSEHFKFGSGGDSRTEKYEELRRRCRENFNERFWQASGGYLYDVIDGPGGDDRSIRPNQLFALSLRHAVLDEAHRRSVLNVVTTHLLTPCGLRTLSPQAEGYKGRIAQHQEEQQSSLHQGSAWPWLFGPYVDALLRVDGQTPVNRKNHASETQKYRENTWHRGIRLLDSFREQLRSDMLGAIGAAYDGDAPQRPHIYMASATGTGEIVRVYKLLAQMGVPFSRQTLSV
jgi:glycogen debranching enzyme